MLPTEVLYVGLPISGSAIVQSVLKHPLGNNVEQRLVWCADAMTDERAVNWCILESVAGATTAEYIVFVGSDVVLHPAFVETLVRKAAENAIATSFPMILSLSYPTSSVKLLSLRANRLVRSACWLFSACLGKPARCIAFSRWVRLGRFWTVWHYGSIYRQAL